MSTQHSSATQPALYHPPHIEDHSDEADLVVQSVRDSADYKYRETKKRKQEEMSHRIAEAQRTGDRNRLRNEKKRVDNHASAVASRFKQEFLVKSFDTLVRAKLSESAHLARLVRDKDMCIARKDAQIRELSRRVGELTNEVDMLQARLNGGEGEGWFAGEFGQGGGFVNGEAEGSGVACTGETAVGVENAAARGSVESTLTTLLRAVGNHGTEVNMELYKIGVAPWEPLQNEMVSERQSLVRSQFRVDKTDNVFDPAA
eukprot:GFKZ01000857.1.p1 GENE.GFKZ01000857.1~~GFKZ01000857.1.p1  ORF type:complete len:270 (-),score=56.02 GFKZ01000857.1:59-835(-)